MICHECGSALTGKQQKYCSRRCRGRARQRDYRNKNPMRHRWDAWTRHGGVATLEEYSEVVLLQSCCEGCGIYVHDYSDRRVDHDHETGKIRGMLCDTCNTTEGKYEGNLERIRGLLNYMERNK